MTLVPGAREQPLQEVSTLPAPDFPRGLVITQHCRGDDRGEQPARSPSACIRAGEEA